MRSTYGNPKKNPGWFGLSFGWIGYYPERLIKNAFWYDEKLNQLGWGDLKFEDFLNIRSWLADDEIFIVLGEWEGTNVPEDNEKRLAFIVRNARYFITSKEFFITASFFWDDAEYEEIGGLIFTRVPKIKLWKELTRGMPALKKIRTFFQVL